MHRNIGYLLHQSITSNISQSPVITSMLNKRLELLCGTMIVTNAETARTNINFILYRLLAVAQVCKYHLYSIWLFTSSDLKTIIGPSFVFGATNALAGAEYGLKSSDQGLSRAIVQRLALVLLYVWTNLLPFAINNQKSSDAIKEDAINKPWRTPQ